MKRQRKTASRVRETSPTYFDPRRLLHFIELPGFESDWSDLGLDDGELTNLQFAIMEGGKNAPIVAGTGGLRKLRHSPKSWPVGKSGGIRVCFAYFEMYGIVLLIAAYAKSDYDNISSAGKNRIKKLLHEAEAELKTLHEKH